MCSAAKKVAFTIASASTLSAMAGFFIAGASPVAITAAALAVTASVAVFAIDRKRAQLSSAHFDKHVVGRLERAAKRKGFVPVGGVESITAVAPATELALRAA